MIYATIETFHQIIYLQSSAMNSLLFIFPSLSSYFMSVIMNTLLIKKKKVHMSLKFSLDKIIKFKRFKPLKN